MGLGGMDVWMAGSLVLLLVVLVVLLCKGGTTDGNAYPLELLWLLWLLGLGIMGDYY